MKTIAFYLPQFHPIPENDRWWGKGFTEWTNVAKAKPLFEGHFQPRLPSDLGYYDLRLDEVQKQQITMAKAYGIHGFCYHYYWFEGKKLLDLPLERHLKDKTLDFPFCLCYANENWTRRWDGDEHEILIQQKHGPENDRNFIKEIIPVMKDERYIRINGKPILLVYRTKLFPNPMETVMIWREEAQKAGLELYLCKCETFHDVENPAKIGFDASVEFPPHNLRIPCNNKPEGYHIYEYLDAVNYMLHRPWPDFKLFKTAMLAWDNTARKLHNALVYNNFKIEYYQSWLASICKNTIERYPEEERLVFINAWNEWAEGTYLEPDRMHGHAYLAATKQAIESVQAKEKIYKYLNGNNEARKEILNFIEHKEKIEHYLVETIKRHADKTFVPISDPNETASFKALTTMRNSWSWKITKPLRRLRDLWLSIKR